MIEIGEMPAIEFVQNKLKLSKQDLLYLSDFKRFSDDVGLFHELDESIENAILERTKIDKSRNQEMNDVYVSDNLVDKDSEE